MSYARFGCVSDVYIYSDGENLNCCGCRLGIDFASADFDEICEHLIQHLDAGHKVPKYCIERLFVEALDGEWGVAKLELPPGTHLTGAEIIRLLCRAAELKEGEHADD